MGNKFVYRLGFKRFEDEYSVISANIPNMPEKKNFRRQWLRENPELTKRAKKITDPVVLNEEGEVEDEEIEDV